MKNRTNDNLDWSEFMKVEMRAGTIISAKEFKKNHRIF